MSVRFGSSRSRWIGRAMIPVVAATVLLPGGVASASPPELAITGYDIVDGPAAGSGGWNNFYSGTYTATRLDPIQGGTVGNYVGGGGTLNDNVVSSLLSETLLLFIGSRGTPSITLHLATAAKIDSIELFGGNIGGNFFPGLINQVTVDVAGTRATLSTQPFGDPSAVNVPFNDRVSLAGTPLASIAADAVVLSGFAADFGSDQISITEVKIYGTPVASQPQLVNIEIRPGNRPAFIDLSAGGFVPVAILATSTFDATAVDRTTLTFGRTGDEPSLKKCEKARDVNRDRLKDLICSFKVRTTGLTVGDQTATLKGRLIDGRPIIGHDTVRVRR